MARTGRRQKGRDRFHILAGLTLFLGLMVLGGGAGYWWWINRTGGLDAMLCPITGAKAHTIILIDKTDLLSPIQLPALKQLVSEVSARRAADFRAPRNAEDPIKVGELLSIFVLGEDYTKTPEPIFERCNPGLGASAGIWFANPDLLEELYKREFDDKLVDVAPQLLASSPSKWSPIMEMLQMVSINGFRRAAINGPRRLIVVSDMLHNTTDYSHFRAIVPFDKFQTTTYYQKVRTDLSTVDMHLRYLMYSPQLQTMRLNQFWEEYFASLGAGVKTVRQLQ